MWIKRTTDAGYGRGDDGRGGAAGPARRPGRVPPLYRDTRPRRLRYLDALVGEVAEDVAAEI